MTPSGLIWLRRGSREAFVNTVMNLSRQWYFSTIIATVTSLKKRLDYSELCLQLYDKSSLPVDSLIVSY